MYLDDEGRLKKHATHNEPETVEGVEFVTCELVLNFGLFRTSLFHDIKWDEDLPICEHTDYFYRASQRHKFGYMKQFKCLHHRDRPSPQYLAGRGRRIKLVDPSPKTELLRKCSQALTAIDCPFFLSDGVVLGVLRENDFIEHDPDVDIGVFYEDFKDKVDVILETMLTHDFDLKEIHGTPEEGYQYSFKRAGIKLDIFIYYHTDNDLIYHSVWNDVQQKQYLFRKFKVEEINFNGMQVNIPSPLIQYVIDHYGITWEIPDKSWSWWSSPPNTRVKNGTVESENS